MKFEKAIARLEEIKQLLESGNLSLDESVELYKESVDCTKECLTALKETDGKIVAIKKEIDELIEKPLDNIEE